jgi:outer membrane lipoprotein LolB
VTRTNLKTFQSVNSGLVQASLSRFFSDASRVTRHASRCISFVVALTLSACATVPKTSAPVRSAADLDTWQANGRIAVSGAGGGGSGSFTWEQRGGDSSLQIRGPVGIGSVRLTLSGDLLSADLGGGQRYTAQDAEAELADRLGARLPIQDLRYWLKGIAAPGDHQWAEDVDPTVLLQHDWRIQYQDFTAVSGVRLPLKLVATSGPAKVRVVVDRWKVK